MIRLSIFVPQNVPENLYVGYQIGKVDTGTLENVNHDYIPCIYSSLPLI